MAASDNRSKTSLFHGQIAGQLTELQAAGARPSRAAADGQLLEPQVAGKCQRVEKRGLPRRCQMVAAEDSPRMTKSPAEPPRMMPIRLTSTDSAY